MTIIITNKLSTTAWREFVDQNPSGNIFHTSEMFEVFERTRKHKPKLLAAVDQSGKPLALLTPVEISVFDGLLRKLTTRAIAFGSTLWEPTKEGQEALSLLLDAYTRETKNSILFTELRNLASQVEIQPILSKNGFVYEDHLNYLIDLNLPEEAIFQNIGTHTRKNIRRGLNRGKVRIEEVKDRKQVKICYDLIQKTYHLAHVPVADISLFESAFDILSSKGMIRFVLAYVDQTPIATSVELLYKDQVYGWYNGLNRDYGNYLSNELLMWNILQWSAQKGYHIYDFGGAGKPDQEYGVRDFKAKFGGRLVCFGRHTFVHAPNLFRISVKGYNLIRNFF